MLTNQEDGDFTITELEVWEVEFLVIHYIKLNKYIGMIEMRHRDRQKRKKKRKKRDKMKTQRKHEHLA